MLSFCEYGVGVEMFLFIYEHAEELLGWEDKHLGHCFWVKQGLSGCSVSGTERTHVPGGTWEGGSWMDPKQRKVRLKRNRFHCSKH